MRSSRSKCSFLVLGAVLLAARVAAAQDHGGADWTVANLEDISGTHTNVGRFVVPPGVIALVTGTTRIEARRIEVGGIIDGNYTGSPGGGTTATNGQDGSGVVGSVGVGGATVEEGGGGGGGYGGAGGGGGGLLGGASGGAVTGTADGTDALEGNGGGGGAAVGSCTPGAGGDGGARVELVASSVVIAPGALVLANGGNGGSASGSCSGANAAGGGGGGSGGAIVIQAPLIDSSGGLHAAGGNGGAGNGTGGKGCDGGGGAGGRIKLIGAVSGSGATLDAVGGNAGGTRCAVPAAPGGDGTTYTEVTGAAAPVVPASLAFGSERTGGTPGPAVNLVVQNGGDADFVIDALTVSNTEFEVDPATLAALPITVAAGSPVTLVLHFDPAVGQVGARSATLTIRTNDPAQEEYTTTLGGTGLEPDLSSSAAPIAFANRRVGTTSAASTFTFTNAGNTDLVVSSLSLVGANAGDFAVSMSGSTTVAPAQIRTVNVTFTPSAAGPRAASVRIASDDPSSPYLLAVSGTGIAPVMVVTTDVGPPLTYPVTKVGTTSATSHSVTIQNTGTDVLNVTLAELGPNGGDFAFAPATTSFAVAAGTSYPLSMTFTPAAAGARSNTLRVTDADGFSSAVDVAMNGQGANPSISLAPSPLTFAARRVGTASGASTVTITNASAVPLVISSITKGGVNGADFTLSAPATPLTIPPAGTGNFTVTFLPSARGNRTCTVSVASDAPSSPTVLNVSGQGIAPVVAITPPSLAFGGQRINTTSAAQTITIDNTGDDSLTITSFGIPGLNNEDYQLTGAPAAGTVLLPADPPIVVSVAFRPLSTGAQNATLVMGTDDPSPPAAKNVALTGTGTTALIAFAPGSRDFGNVLVGSASAGFAFTVSNSGTAPLTVTGVSFGPPNPGQFALVSPPVFPLTVPAAGSAILTVRFQPTSTGVKNSSLVVVSDADNAASVPAPTLSGTGVKPDISITSGALSFGNQRVGTTSAAQTINVQNVGSSALNVTVGSTGANPADFAASPGSFSVPSGGSQLVSVTFSPIATGARSAAVRFTSDDQETPTVDVAVSGNGVSPEITLTTPATGIVDFGEVRVGEAGTPQTVVIRNDGSMVLTVSAASLMGTDATQFTVTAPALPTTVAPGATLSATVNFLPSGEGPKSATLRITADDDSEPQTFVTLQGTGTQRRVAVTPSPIAFAETRVGETAADVTVTIRNAGTAPLTVVSVSSTLSVFPIVTPPATLPVTLGPGASTTLVMDFVPTAYMDYAGSLTITSDDPSGDLQVPVTGPGRVAEFAIAPMGIAFGEVRVDGAGASQAVTLENIGSAGFVVGAVTLSDTTNFSLTPMALPTTLAPPPTGGGSGGALPIVITAHPVSVGTKNAIVTVMTDVPAAPMATFTVTADGVAPYIATSCMALDFGAVDVQAGPKAETCTISNTGSAPLYVSDISITGPGAGAYTISGGLPTPGTVAELTGAPIEISYDPSFESAAEPAATLSISSDGLGAPMVQIPLSGHGIDRHLALSAMRLDFPATRRNSADGSRLGVRITNNGDAILGVSELRIEGPGAPAFTIEGTPPTAVAGRGSVDLVVKFVPTAAVMFDADLVIVNDDDGSPMAQIDLVGLGILPPIVVSPGSINLSTVAVGVTKRSTERVAIANMSGDEPVALAQVCIGSTTGACDAASPFTVVGFSGGSDLDPLGRTEIDVEFTPAEARVYTGYVLVLVEDDPVPVSFVTLSGEGIDDVQLGGGGGCHVGRSGAPSAPRGLWLLAVLPALGVRRSRRWLTFLVLSALILSTSPARGDGDRALDLGTFRPTPSGAQPLITVERAAVAPKGTVSFGFFVEYAKNPLVSRRTALSSDPDRPVSDRTALLIGAAYAPVPRLELGAVIPVLQQSGFEKSTGVDAADGTVLGDVALHAKYFVLSSAPLSLGASTSLSLPTGDDTQFAGSKSVTFHARGILEIDVGALQLAGNGGVRIRPEEAVLINVHQGNELTYGLGIGYRATRAIQVVGELFGAVGLEEGASGAVSPLEAVGGVRYRVAREVAVIGGVGRGLLSGVGAPDVRVFLAMTWSPGYEPLSPSAIGRRSGGDGEPDEPIVVDRGDDDEDGIINSSDRCPSEAEDVDGFNDEDGCPDRDNDNDGLADGVDACPNKAEDIDGNQDDDGCVDADDDGDRVPDVNDKCPDSEEDYDGFEDRDGCDDPDNDRDGIPDVIDQCALERETINGNADDDGCADEGESLVLVMNDRLELLEPILFVGDTANLKPVSKGVLKQLGATMLANPHITKMRIGAHVGSRGAADRDEALSKKRAEAVKKYLVDRGVEASRLEIKAWGSSRPIRQNGPHEINDRIEIIVLETNGQAPGRDLDP